LLLVLCSECSHFPESQSSARYFCNSALYQLLITYPFTISGKTGSDIATILSNWFLAPTKSLESKQSLIWFFSFSITWFILTPFLIHKYPSTHTVYGQLDNYLFKFIFQNLEPLFLQSGPPTFGVYGNLWIFSFIDNIQVSEFY